MTRPRLYEVIGPNAVDGTATGGTVRIDDQGRARRLIAGGHIRQRKTGPATPPAGARRPTREGGAQDG